MFKQALKQFIQEKLLQNSRSEIKEDEPLIERGIVDSMGLMQILLFIQDQTGIRIPDEEVLPENFQTIASIEQTVERLRSRLGPTS